MNSAKVAGTFAVGMLVALVVVAYGYKPPAVIETHHHVKVLKRIAKDMWRMQSDEMGTFVYQGCPDFPNSTVIWPGYEADHATWEERGSCKSIRATGLGFVWERDENGNVKEIDNAQRASGQMD